MNQILLIIVTSTIVSIGTIVFLHVLFEDRSHIKGLKIPKHYIQSRGTDVIDRVNERLEREKIQKESQKKWVDNLINRYSYLDKYGIHFKRMLCKEKYEVLVYCDNSDIGFSIAPEDGIDGYDMIYQKILRGNNYSFGIKKYDGWDFIGFPQKQILQSNELVYLLTDEYYKSMNLGGK